MRYSKEHIEETRRSILDAAAVKFKEDGLSGVGVVTIASQAEVTTGAIYNQFQSKDRLFAEVVESGLERLLDGLVQAKEGSGEDWLAQFSAQYLSKQHIASVGKGCVLPTLSLDVGRAVDPTKTVFAKGLEEVVETISDDGESTQRAMLILASLLGSVILARATGNDKVRKELLDEILTLLDRS